MQERRNRFVVSAKLPSLNEYTRANRNHWATGGRMKAEIEEIIIWSIRCARNRGEVHPVHCPVHIEFVWHEKTRRRDPDNIFSAKKFLLDAMQTAGILEGDGQRHITGFTDWLVQDKADYVEVVIHESERWTSKQKTEVET